MIGDNGLKDAHSRKAMVNAHDSPEREEMAELRRQRDLYEGVLTAQSEAGRGGIVVVEGHQVRFADAQFCAMSGYAREELEAMPSLAQVFPEDGPGRGRKGRTRQGAEEGYHETSVRCKDGRRLSVEVASKVQDTGGWPRTVLLVRESPVHSRDVERTRLQAHILEALGEAVVATDMQDRVTFWNEAATRLYGWTAAETIGKKLKQFLVPDDLYEPADEVLAEIVSGKAWSGKFIVRRKDGTAFPVQVTDTPVRDEGGNVIGVVGVSTDITEREEAEAALRDSERRFRSSFEDAGIGMALLSPDGRYLQANQALCEIVGYSEEDLLAKTYRDITHPDDLEQGLKINDTMLRGEDRSTSVEKRYIRKDGSTVWADLTVSMLRNSSDEPLYYISLVQDITERKRTEARLRESEAKFRSLVERLPAIIYIEAIDEETTQWDMLYVSPQHEKLLGYSAEEWQSDSRMWERLLHPEDRARVMAEDERTDKTGEPFRVDYRFVARDGRTVWVRDEAMLVYDEEGKPLFWQGVMYDITEQKRIEEELRLRDRAIAASSNGIIISDPRRADNPIIYVNAAFERITGHSAAEALGRNCRFLQGPDRKQPGAAELRAAVEEGTEARVVLRNYHKDGTLWWNELHLAPVRDAGGSVTHFIGVQTDVSERVRAEEEIRRLNEGLENRIAQRTSQLRAYAAQLQLSNRELQEFAYVASHDLQEPLRKVLAFGERLRGKYSAELGERGLDYLGRMEHAAQRMQSLVEDLLALSRVTTRARPFGPVDLGEVARGVISDLEALLEESGGRVEVDDLPTIEADRLQMRQLLQNLIGNALKFRKPGEPAIVRVRGRLFSERRLGDRARADAGEDLCQITVEDNGIGFDEQYIGRIFTPFERLHGRDAYEGTGMGLAICRKVVERHGGEIGATSAPGSGAKFVVTLPAKQGEAGAEVKGD